MSTELALLRLAADFLFLSAGYTLCALDVAAGLGVGLLAAAAMSLSSNWVDRGNISSLLHLDTAALSTALSTVAREKLFALATLFCIVLGCSVGDGCRSGALSFAFVFTPGSSRNRSSTAFCEVIAYAVPKVTGNVVVSNTRRFVATCVSALAMPKLSKLLRAHIDRWIVDSAPMQFSPLGVEQAHRIDALGSQVNAVALVLDLVATFAQYGASSRCGGGVAGAAAAAAVCITHRLVQLLLLRRALRQLAVDAPPSRKATRRSRDNKRVVADVVFLAQEHRTTVLFENTIADLTNFLLSCFRVRGVVEEGVGISLQLLSGSSSSTTIQIDGRESLPSGASITGDSGHTVTVASDMYSTSRTSRISLVSAESAA